MNPLSKYLISNGVTMSDWGIDEMPDIDNDDINKINMNLQFNKYLQSTKFESDYKIKFWEKFKYNLIISNLLNDSLSISQNDQNINQLYHQIKQSKPTNINKNFTELIINHRYQLINNDLINDYNIITINFLIIFLIKRRGNFKTSIKLLKILIILAHKILNLKRIYMSIQSNKIFIKLSTFLINNYKLNKNIIKNINHVRELELYNTNQNVPIIPNLSDFPIIPPSVETTKLRNDEILNNFNDFLNILIVNVKSYCFKLLIYLNGSAIEKYCTLNNITFDEPQPMGLNLSTIKYKVKLFNNYRKFLVIELLTINEDFNFNFYLCSIYNHFKFDFNSGEHIKFDEKLLLVFDILNEFDLNILNFNKILCDLNKFGTSGLKVDETVSDTNIDKLVHKLSSIIKTLKDYDKFNQSSNQISDKDSQVRDERIGILNEITTELKKSIELNEINKTTINNTNTGLKFFKNKSINRKKRISLPLMSDKKLGLQLNLLTIFEEKVSYDDNYLNILPNYEIDETPIVNNKIKNNTSFSDTKARSKTIASDYDINDTIKVGDSIENGYLPNYECEDMIDNEDSQNYESEDTIETSNRYSMNSNEEDVKLSKYEIAEKLELLYNTKTSSKKSLFKEKEINVKEKVDRVSLDSSSEEFKSVLSELKGVLG